MRWSWSPWNFRERTRLGSGSGSGSFSQTNLVRRAKQRIEALDAKRSSDDSEGTVGSGSLVVGETVSKAPRDGRTPGPKWRGRR